MASAELEYNRGLGHSPHWGPGAKPLEGGLGTKSPEDDNIRKN